MHRKALIAIVAFAAAAVPASAVADPAPLQLRNDSTSASPAPVGDAVTSFAGTAGLAQPLDLINRLAEGGSTQDPVADAVTSFAGTAGLAQPLDLMNQLAEGGSTKEPVADAVTSFAGTAGLAQPLDLSNKLAEGQSYDVARVATARNPLSTVRMLETQSQVGSGTVSVSRRDTTTGDGLSWSLIVALSTSVALGLIAAGALAVRLRHHRTVSLSH